jgi:plastocyanin
MATALRQNITGSNDPDVAVSLLHEHRAPCTFGGSMIVIPIRRLSASLFLIVLIAFLTGCGGGYSSPSPSSPSPTPTPAPAPSPTPSGSAATAISIPTNARALGTSAFVPNPVTVAQGTVVNWSNTDAANHDIVSDTGAFDSGRLGTGDSFRFTFAAPGTYPYHCSIHPGMTGTIVVQ